MPLWGLVLFDYSRNTLNMLLAAIFMVFRSCASAGHQMETVRAVRSVCCVWARCGRSAVTVWVSVSVSLLAHVTVELNLTTV